MTVKNKRMKVLLWKYKTDIILPELGPDKGYGELELLNEILDDQSLLSKATDLQEVLNLLQNRKSDGNLSIIFEIMSKITTVTSNGFVEELILSTFHRYSNTLDDEIKPGERHYWIITCLNLLKLKKLPSLLDKLRDSFPIENLYSLINTMNKAQTDTYEEFFLMAGQQSGEQNSPSADDEEDSQNEGGSDDEGEESEGSSGSSSSGSASSTDEENEDIDKLKYWDHYRLLTLFNCQYQSLFDLYTLIHFKTVLNKDKLRINLGKFVSRFLEEHVLENFFTGNNLTQDIINEIE